MLHYWLFWVGAGSRRQLYKYIYTLYIIYIYVYPIASQNVLLLMSRVGDFLEMASGSPSKSWLSNMIVMTNMTFMLESHVTAIPTCFSRSAYRFLLAEVLIKVTRHFTTLCANICSNRWQEPIKCLSAWIGIFQWLSQYCNRSSGAVTCSKYVKQSKMWTI